MNMIRRILNFERRKAKGGEEDLEQGDLGLGLGVNVLDRRLAVLNVVRSHE